MMQQNKPPSRPSSRQALLQQHQQIIPDAYQPHNQVVNIDTLIIAWFQS